MYEVKSGWRLSVIANVLDKLTAVSPEDIILRTFMLFVQSAHTVLKYADAQFFGKQVSR